MKIVVKIQWRINSLNLHFLFTSALPWQHCTLKIGVGPRITILSWIRDFLVLHLFVLFVFFMFLFVFLLCVVFSLSLDFQSFSEASNQCSCIASLDFHFHFFFLFFFYFPVLHRCCCIATFNFYYKLHLLLICIPFWIICICIFVSAFIHLNVFPPSLYFQLMGLPASTSLP